MFRLINLVTWVILSIVLNEYGLSFIQILVIGFICALLCFISSVLTTEKVISTLADIIAKREENKDDLNK